MACVGEGGAYGDVPIGENPIATMESFPYSVSPGLGVTASPSSPPCPFFLGLAICGQPSHLCKHRKVAASLDTVTPPRAIWL